MIFLTRRATFSASHYYWNEAWPRRRTEQVFGRCANRNGHGHNYTLEVTVAGEPDPVTGFVVDLKWLKDVMEREVLSAYDHGT
jgi:6-pyruvoyltetrahydropterin/6-carboxytetrahydropterin synthase